MRRAWPPRDDRSTPNGSMRGFPTPWLERTAPFAQLADGGFPQRDQSWMGGPAGPRTAVNGETFRARAEGVLWRGLDYPSAAPPWARDDGCCISISPLRRPKLLSSTRRVMGRVENPPSGGTSRASAARGFCITPLSTRVNRMLGQRDPATRTSRLGQRMLRLRTSRTCTLHYSRDCLDMKLLAHNPALPRLLASKKPVPSPSFVCSFPLSKRTPPSIFLVIPFSL